jgi:hypothetical protein
MLKIRVTNSLAQPGANGKNEALYQKFLRGKLDNLPQEQKDLIEPILLIHAHVFYNEDKLF